MTNYKPRLIVPTAPTQPTQPTQKTQLTQPTQPTPTTAQTVSIQKQMEIYKQAQKQNDQQTVSFLANYNDPTELNSYIDALTNRAAVSKEFGDTWGTISTVSGTVAVLAFVTSAVLAALAAFTGGATAPAAAAAASAGAKATAGATATAGAAATLSKASAVAATVAKIAAIPSVPAAAKVTYDYGFKPIANGKPKEALLNMLMNFGETMDYTSNPVKGLFIEGPEGFIKATGLTDEGRPNYDYDTGTVITDMLLEIVSDPLNLIEGTATRIAKTSAKRSAKESTEALVNQVVTAISKETGVEVSAQASTVINTKVQKTIAKLIQESTTLDPNKEVLETFRKQSRERLQRTLINAIKTEFPDLNGTQIQRIFKQAGRDAATGRFTQSLFKQIENIKLDTLATDVLKGVSTITKYTDDAQRFLTKMSFMTSGYGAGPVLAKEAFDSITEWNLNRVIKALIYATDIDKVKGLMDLAKFETVKKKWEVLGKYADTFNTDKTGAPLHNLDTFYSFITGQFERDQQLIRKTIQEHATDYVTQSATLDATFKDLYNIDFKGYIEYLKRIDVEEGGRFKNFADYAEFTHNTLIKQTLASEASAGVRTSAQLYAAHNIADIIKHQNSALEIIKNLATTTDVNKASRNLYALKLNDYYINAALLNDPNIYAVFEEIASNKNIGAFLDNIIKDANTLAPDVSAHISDCVRTVKDAGKAFINLRDLYDNIGKLTLPSIDKIPDAYFKRYVIDQIFGMSGDVTELLMGFDSVTIPSLMNKLETFLYDVDFRVNNYPNLREQIAGVFKNYLEAQQAANLKTIKTAIVQDFTQSIDTLLKEFPAYANELNNLATANQIIKTTLKSVKELNADLFNHVIFDTKSIFNVYNTRQLSDMGLALRTINTKESLDLFQDISDLSPALHLEAERLGKRIRDTVKRCEQYTFRFDTDFEIAINEIYEKVYVKFLHEGNAALKLHAKLLATSDPFEQFAQLIEIKKAMYLDDSLKDLWNIFIITLPDNLQPYIIYIQDPSSFFKTEFAWDAMAQSAFYAEKAFNEDVINIVNTYNNLTTAAKKITNDFSAVREVLFTNKADLPKILQQERYAKVANKVVDTLDWFTEKFNSYYNKTIADNQIADLYSEFLKYPGAYAIYQPTIEQLDAYWKGQLVFEQPKKWEMPEGTRDPFTDFYKDVLDLQRAYTELQQNQQTLAYLRKEFAGTKVISKLNKLAETPEVLDRFLYLLNEHNAIKTNADLQEYLNFLKQLNVNTVLDESKVLPLELIPNAFKNKLYAFITETYHITDVALAYDLLANYLGYFKPWVSHPNLTLVLTQHADLTQFQNIIHHEALHNITQILTESELEELYKSVIVDLQNVLPQSEYNNILTVLFDTYDIHYHLSSTMNKSDLFIDFPKLDTQHQRAFVEEIVAMTFGDNLPNYIRSLNPNTQKILSDYAQTLRKKYQQIIRERVPLNEEYYKAYLLRNPYIKNIKKVTPWDPIRDQQAVRKAIFKATDANAKGSVYRMLNWSPEELKQELAYRKRVLIFGTDDLANGDLQNKYKRLKKLCANDADIIFREIPELQLNVIVLAKTAEVKYSGRQVYLNKIPLHRPRFKKSWDEFKYVDDILEDSETRHISKMLNELSEDLEELTGSALGDSMGDYFTKDTMKRIIDILPEDVKKYLDVADMLNNSMWYDAFNFNESIIGGTRARMRLGMLSSDMLINAKNSVTNALCYVKAKTEYTNLVFDSVFSIGNKNGIYARFTNAELLEALQSNRDYKLVCLVDDKKYGQRVREILPINEEAIAKGRELGAVIVPLQTYKDMVKIVNHRLGSEGWLKIWNRIIYVYKTGYLLRPGAWIRNWIDTNLKTNLELGADARSYRNQARKLLSERERINDILAKRGEGVLKREALIEYFELNPDGLLNMQTYKELDYLLESQGALGNIMKELETTEGRGLWDTFTHYSGKIVDTANQTENVNRLAVYLAKLDEGLDTTAALAAVAKTHFDYSYKSVVEQLVEMVFPFATFSLRNLSYWAEAVDKHPWLMRNYVHFLKPTWDFKDFTPEELAANYTVQNQIINGQLPLAEFNNKLVLFKANPSIQDAMAMFNNPVNNIYEKLAAPLSVPLDLITDEYTQPTNLLPLVGPMIYDTKTALKTGSPMPSLIGVNKQYVKFENENLSKVNSYTDKTYRTPKYRNNIVYDSYATKGIKRYKVNFYPVIDIAHDIKSRYSVNVYNRIKNKVKTDVYQGIRYRIRLDVNRFR